MLSLEPVDELLERGVARDIEVVPERPFNLAVLRETRRNKVSEGSEEKGVGGREAHLLLLGRDGIREAEEGKREIDEAVLVVLELVLAIDDLQPRRTNEG